MKNSLQFFFQIFLLALVSCNVQESNELKVDNNDDYSINYQNSDRVSGIYAFTNGGKSTKSCLIEAFDDHTIILKLSIGQNGINGKEYAGIFFDSIPGFQQGIALHKYEPVKSWTRPMLFDNFKDVEPYNNQFMYWQYSDGLYAILMPLGGQGFLGNLGRNDKNLGIWTNSLKDSLYTATEIPVAIISFGMDFYKTLDQTVKDVGQLMGHPQNLRENKKFPLAFEKLGWCTWNAFGHDLSEAKIRAGVNSFPDLKIPLGYLIIDDGWQRIDDNKLMSIQPDTTKFPNGFKSLIHELKTNANLDHVGVWHTLNGYWEGFNSNSQDLQKYLGDVHSYQDQVPWLKDTLSTFVVPSLKKGHLKNFYKDLYEFLREQDISMVKVDNQNVVHRFANDNLSLLESGRLSAKQLQETIAEYFDGAVVNCMDMSANVLYNFGSSAVARAVEDYHPADSNTNYTLEYSCNAAGHVLMCHFNSIWFSGFVYPDYDMFQTHRDDAEYHAIARAINGGPIYITDIPGKQSKEILSKLMFNDGTIIRADQPSLPTEDCLFQLEGSKPFKAFSKECETGLLAAWNASDTNLVAGTISPSDIHGLKGEKFVAYEHFSKAVFPLTKNEKMDISLARMKFSLYNMIPLENNIAVIGLVNKYNSRGAIDFESFQSNTLKINLVEGGELGVYCLQKPIEIMVNGKIIEEQNIQFENNLLLVDIQDISENCEVLVRF